MTTTVDIGFQPAALFQGEAASVNTPKQEPKTDTVQPKQAPVADTQSSDQSSVKKQSAEVSASNNNESSSSSSNGERGQNLDVVV